MEDFITKYKIYLDIFTLHHQKESVWRAGPIINQYPALLFPSPHHWCILPLCCCPSFHHSPRACTHRQRKSADLRRRKTFHPQPICCHISICRYKYKSRCFKERHLFGVAIIEPLPFGHAVKFALARSFQIWDPVVVLSLKKLLVVLGTLFLPVNNNIK